VVAAADISRRSSDAERDRKNTHAGAKRSRLEPVKTFVRLAESHWDGIIAWQHSQISNRLLEGANSLMHTANAEPTPAGPRPR